MNETTSQTVGCLIFQNMLEHINQDLYKMHQQEQIIQQQADTIRQLEQRQIELEKTVANLQAATDGNVHLETGEAIISVLSCKTSAVCSSTSLLLILCVGI